jgi:hypothetical protein
MRLVNFTYEGDERFPAGNYSIATIREGVVDPTGPDDTSTRVAAYLIAGIDISELSPEIQTWAKELVAKFAAILNPLNLSQDDLDENEKFREYAENLKPYNKYFKYFDRAKITAYL